LDGVAQGELVVDAGFLVVAHLIVYYTEVDVCEEFACDISDLLMLGVVLDGVFEIIWVLFTQFHEVDTDAIVSESFSMHIANRSTHLQELLVLGHSLLILAQVIVQHTSGVVGTALIS